MEDISYITIPSGFKANGVASGMKCSDRANINPDTPKYTYLDVGLVASDTPCSVAGVYTSNLVKGHSLVRSIGIIESKKKVRGIIVNSKNANAAVGKVGIEDADFIAGSVAKELGCTADEILTASTGVIGSRLPLDLISAAIPGLVSGLSSSEETAHNSEYAMMTTDTVPKEVSAEITLADERTIRIAGQAKGSGMIHPNLATMIGIFTTDADIDPDLLKKMLKDAVKYTFNRVSVDGDTSVCDMVVVLANGASGVKIEEGSEDADVFAEEAFVKISHACSHLTEKARPSLLRSRYTAPQTKQMPSSSYPPSQSLPSVRPLSTVWMQTAEGSSPPSDIPVLSSIPSMSTSS